MKWKLEKCVIQRREKQQQQNNKNYLSECSILKLMYNIRKYCKKSIKSAPKAFLLFFSFTIGYCKKRNNMLPKEIVEIKF